MKKHIYIILEIIAALIAAIFLIPLKSYKQQEEENKSRDGQTYYAEHGCIPQTYKYQKTPYIKYIKNYWLSKLTELKDKTKSKQ